MGADVAQISIREEKIQIRVVEERVAFSSPLSLSAPALCGVCSTNNRVDHIPMGAPTTLDQLELHSSSLAVKWLLFLFDQETGLAVSSEINLLRRGGQLWFTEYAVLGDSSLLIYDIDVLDDGERLRLVLTSRSETVLDARTVRIGVFH